MEIRILAGITTFNPNIERLRSNISAIYGQVNCVLIVDNHSDNIDSIEALLQQFPKVCIVKNIENRGIAYAMNQIGKYAIQSNCTWFLTLDQDSVCPFNYIQEALKHVHPSVGIIAPNIKFNKPFINRLFHIKNNNDDAIVNDYVEVLDVISSGQLINADVWQSIGGFWNYLFIDYVDHELCFNMTRNGYKIIKLNNLFMSHEPGISIKVLGIETAKQSPMREYYWARNSRLVYWSYRDEYSAAIKHTPFFATLKRIANSILVGENVISKIKAIYYGVKDAYAWKKNYGSSMMHTPSLIQEKRRY